MGSSRVLVRRRRNAAYVLVVGLLVAVGCGPDDDGDDGAEDTVAEEETGDTEALADEEVADTEAPAEEAVAETDPPVTDPPVTDPPADGAASDTSEPVDDRAPTDIEVYAAQAVGNMTPIDLDAVPTFAGGTPVIQGGGIQPIGYHVAEVGTDQFDPSTDGIPPTWTIWSGWDPTYFTGVDIVRLIAIEFDALPEASAGVWGVSTFGTTPGTATIAAAPEIPTYLEGASGFTETTQFPDGQTVDITGLANDAGGFDTFTNPSLVATNVSEAGNFAIIATNPQLATGFAIFNLETDNPPDAYAFLQQVAPEIVQAFVDENPDAAGVLGLSTPP